MVIKLQSSRINKSDRFVFCIRIEFALSMFTILRRSNQYVRRMYVAHIERGINFVCSSSCFAMQTQFSGSAVARWWLLIVRRNVKSLLLALLSILFVSAAAYFVHLTYQSSEQVHLLNQVQFSQGFQEHSFSLCINLSDLLIQITKSTYVDKCCSACRLIDCLYAIQRHLDLSSPLDLSSSLDLFELLDALYERMLIAISNIRSNGMQTINIEKVTGYFYMNMMCRIFVLDVAIIPLRIRLEVFRLNGTAVYPRLDERLPYLMYIHSFVFLNQHLNNYIFTGPPIANCKAIYFQKFMLKKHEKNADLTDIKLNLNFTWGASSACFQHCFWRAQIDEIKLKILLKSDLKDYVFSIGSLTSSMQNRWHSQCSICPKYSPLLNHFNLVEAYKVSEMKFVSRETDPNTHYFFLYENPMLLVYTLKERYDSAAKLQLILNCLAATFSLRMLVIVRWCANLLIRIKCNRNRFRQIVNRALPILLTVATVVHLWSLRTHWKETVVSVTRKELQPNDSLSINVCFPYDSKVIGNSTYDTVLQERLCNHYIDRVMISKPNWHQFDLNASDFVFYAMPDLICVNVPTYTSKELIFDMDSQDDLKIRIALNVDPKLFQVKLFNELLPPRMPILYDLYFKNVFIVKFKSLQNCRYYSFDELSSSLYNFTALYDRLKSERRSLRQSDCVSQQVCRHACTTLELFEREDPSQWRLDFYSNWATYFNPLSNQCRKFVDSILPSCERTMIVPSEEDDLLTKQIELNIQQNQLLFFEVFLWSPSQMLLHQMSVLNIWLLLSPSSVLQALNTVFRYRLRMRLMCCLIRIVFRVLFAIAAITHMHFLYDEFQHDNKMIHNRYNEYDRWILPPSFKICIPNHFGPPPSVNWSSIYSAFDSIEFIDFDLKLAKVSHSQILEAAESFGGKTFDLNLKKEQDSIMTIDRRIHHPFVINPFIDETVVCFKFKFEPIYQSIDNQPGRFVSITHRIRLRRSFVHLHLGMSNLTDWMQTLSRQKHKCIIIVYSNLKSIVVNSFLKQNQLLRSVFQNPRKKSSNLDWFLNVSDFTDHQLPDCEKSADKWNSKNCILRKERNFWLNNVRINPSSLEYNSTILEFRPHISTILVNYHRIGLLEFLIQSIIFMLVWFNFSIFRYYFFLHRAMT